MIRNDFVSNSSTSSFIITNPANVNTEKVDLVYKLLYNVNDKIEFNFKNTTDLNKAISIFDACKVEREFLEPENLMIAIRAGCLIEPLTLDLLLQVLKLCTNIYVELGDDYDYESMCKGIQIATLLELECNLNIKPDDSHFFYNSIHNLLEVK